ncbi:MAG: cyanophycinase [Bacteroidota bacterium]|nr:cyanophycinase [Bacteroidota bacterium]MDP3146543.1 cyanophycinase [Bacteroidota bacterium]MDP3556761.1 cyanophycinase [Bacteroidota bacterium]
MSVPKGKLIIIGGSVDKGSFTEKEEDLQAKLKLFEKGILNRIITESKHKTESRIEVITTASSIPAEVGEGYVNAFKQLNVQNVNVLDIRKREEANSEANLERLKNADIVMFTGGDQLRLTSILGGTAFHHLLIDKYENENFVISGTSAGAAASSNNMIYQGNSHEALLKGEVKITGGLGFINNVIIDTHFVQRGRTGRLLYACASNPINLGIGLGEDTGLLITEGHSMEAIGSGLIILVDATHMRNTNMTEVEIGEPISIENIVVHVMSIGDHFDLKNKRLVIDHFKTKTKIEL